MCMGIQAATHDWSLGPQLFLENEQAMRCAAPPPTTPHSHWRPDGWSFVHSARFYSPSDGSRCNARRRALRCKAF